MKTEEIKNVYSDIKNNKNSKYKDDALKYSKSLKTHLLNALIIVVLFGIVYVILSPFIGIVSSSLKSKADLYNPLVYLIPQSPTTENYAIAAGIMNYTKTLVTTLTFVVVITFIQVMITSIVGYGFARFEFPFSKLLFAGVILTIVVPVESIMVPLYTDMRYFSPFGLFGEKGINLINTYVPMVAMTMTGMGLRSGLFIYIFRQFFKGIPKELEEASWIDGAGVFRTYLTIMMPNAVPPIVTVAMFSFVWQYNDVFFANMFMSKFDFISVKVASVASMFANVGEIKDPNYVTVVANAGIVLAVIPILLIYLVLQRYFMESVERSGIVG